MKGISSFLFVNLKNCSFQSTSNKNYNSPRNPLVWLPFYVISMLLFSTGNCGILNNTTSFNASYFHLTNIRISSTEQLGKLLQPIPQKLSSYRGISTNSKTIWISGSKGTVLKLKKLGNESSAVASMNTTATISTDGSKKQSAKESTIHRPSNSKLTPNFHQIFTTWDTLSPLGHENFDFRDIESLDDKTALIMSVGDSSSILKTADGGKTWNVVYKNYSSNVFLDAIAMDWTTGIGFAIGDPQTPLELQQGDSLNLRYLKNYYTQSNVPLYSPTQINWIFQHPKNKFKNPSPDVTSISDVNTHKKKYYLMLLTLDSGNTWQRVPACDAILPQDSIAAFFAGSGSSLQILNSSINRNKSNKITHLNILVGMAGGGINPEFRTLKIQWLNRDKLSSVTSTLPLTISHHSFPLSLGRGAGWGAYGGFYHNETLFWVGGNYLFPDSGESTINIFPFSDINQSIENPKKKFSVVAHTTPSSGYKSGICNCTLLSKNYLFAAGSNGLDISFDHGKTWSPVKDSISTTNLQPIKNSASNNQSNITQIHSNNPSKSMSRNINNQSNNPPMNFTGLNAVGCFNEGIIVVGNKGKVFYLTARP